MMLTVAFLLLAALFAALKLPHVEGAEDIEPISGGGSAWRYRHLVLGAVGIFLYVGAEVSIGSFLVNFMSQPDIAGFSEAEAAHHVSYFWGGAMIGRFVGAVVMRYVNDGKALAFNAVAVIVLLLLTVFSGGHVAMWSVLSIGLFNSIMFPTIFSLSLYGLGKYTSQGSGILCLAIVGRRAAAAGSGRPCRHRRHTSRLPNAGSVLCLHRLLWAEGPGQPDLFKASLRRPCGEASWRCAIPRPLAWCSAKSRESHR